MSKKIKLIIFITSAVLLIAAVLTFLYCKIMVKQSNKSIEIYTDTNYVATVDEEGVYTILNKDEITDSKANQIKIFIE